MYKDNHYHSVVIGAGILGCAIAISLKRRLGEAKVLLIDKSSVCSGVSSVHSGIVRAVNRHSASAAMARDAIIMWKNIEQVWGVPLNYAENGALWITPESCHSDWQNVVESTEQLGIRFEHIQNTEAVQLAQSSIDIKENEAVYYEPDALTINGEELRQALIDGVRLNGVDVHENCEVRRFDSFINTRIEKIITSQGVVTCDHVINASGAWSEKLFHQYGTVLPVRLEPVLTGNWQLQSNMIDPDMPVIADFVNKIYFRSWPGDQLHLHQPRNRTEQGISKRFESTNNNADKFLGPESTQSSWTIHNDVKTYSEKIQKRFKDVGEVKLVNAEHRYFDITPDHRFVIGPDVSLQNVFHCIGAGQGMKYAPVFGEIISRMIVEGSNCDTGYELKDFTVARFQNENDDKRHYQHAIGETI